LKSEKREHMDKKEKKTIEVTLKGILYFITSISEQERVLKILEECELKMNDNKFKNKLDAIFLKLKNNYFDKVDFLIDDILSSKMNQENKKAIYEMVDELQPTIEEAQKKNSGFWDNLRELLKWS